MEQRKPGRSTKPPSSKCDITWSTYKSTTHAGAMLLRCATRKSADKFGLHRGTPMDVDDVRPEWIGVLKRLFLIFSLDRVSESQSEPITLTRLLAMMSSTRYCVCLIQAYLVDAATMLPFCLCGNTFFNLSWSPSSLRPCLDEQYSQGYCDMR